MSRSARSRTAFSAFGRNSAAICSSASELTRLSYLPLFREQMMIEPPAAHRLAGREAIEIRDIAGEPYVQ
jgi:DNA-binding transcriptional LysR family regulator